MYTVQDASYFNTQYLTVLLNNSSVKTLLAQVSIAVFCVCFCLYCLQSRAVKLAVKGQPANRLMWISRLVWPKPGGSGKTVDLGQPANLVQPTEMAQTADFSSRLSGLKVVIRLNNNIISSFLIIAIMSNRLEHIS